MTPVRCAVVGLGRIGSLLEDDRLREKPATHAGAIAANRDCLLVGGADPDEERRAAFARRWKCPAVFAGVEELIEATRPDILHVASPPEAHLSAVATAVRRKVPVIVCEKPLAERVEEARKIAAMHEKGPVRILTNHERRYSRDYLDARAAVESGRHGSLLSMAARLYLGRTRPAAEILLHDGTHLLDIAAFLAGSPLAVHSASLEREPAEALLVTAACGPVPLLMEIGSGRDHLVFELDLSFERGRIVVGNGVYEEWASAPSPYYEGMRSLKKARSGRPRVTGYFSGMMADAVACARDPRREPSSSAVDGVRALEAVYAVLEAAGVRRRRPTRR